MEKDISTEQKIKAAAKKCFLQKGFAATKTRDIAEAADINLALLNYYFRSKEKLFNIIMKESFKEFFSNMIHIIKDSQTILETKIELISTHYKETLLRNPNLPLFIFGELQKNPELFLKNIDFPIGVLKESSLYYQINEKLENNGKHNIDPLNIILNILAINIFPFVIKGAFGIAVDLSKEDTKVLIEKREKLIPEWIMSMIN